MYTNKNDRPHSCRTVFGAEVGIPLDIFRTTLDNALGLEEAKTMELKLLHGWNSTRGGTWNAPHDHAPPRWFVEQSGANRPSATDSADDGNGLFQE